MSIIDLNRAPTNPLAYAITVKPRLYPAARARHTARRLNRPAPRANEE